MNAVLSTNHDTPHSLTLQGMLKNPYPHLASIIRQQRHRMNGTPNMDYIFDLICAAGDQSGNTPDGIEVHMQVNTGSIRFTARYGFEEVMQDHHSFEYQPVGATLYRVISAVRAKIPAPLTP